MDKTRIDAIGVSSLLAGLLWLLSGVAGAATITVNCDAGDKIQVKLSSAKPGDILLVGGTCNENVDIPAEVSRITLDGQGKAAIHGPDSTQPTVFIRGNFRDLELNWPCRQHNYISFEAMLVKVAVKGESMVESVMIN
jgi:hypothetical protein